ncbi:MAG: polyprenyl synthetase family protein [Candidatus Dormibacteria bacterium]|jgi:heptaprenyl diphosphate synthase
MAVGPRPAALESTGDPVYPARLVAVRAAERQIGDLVSSVGWAGAVGPSQERMGLPARLTLRAAQARGGDGLAAIHAAAAAELTQRALEWHASAASGYQPVGLGTLAGDYCLAQAAAALSRYSDVDLEAALSDGLTEAGSALLTTGSAEVASRRLLPACGLSGARAARLSGSDQARWWRAGRVLAGRRPPAVAGRPDALHRLLSADDPLEVRLGQVLATDPEQVAQPMATLLGAGGKRIRARLVLLTGEIGGKFRPDKLLQAAAAMELLHAATLCHDDLVDGATSRRGAPTVAALSGPLVALGVGDYYLGRSSGLVARLDDPRISRHFADALVEIADGQLRELDRRSVWSGELAPYIRVAQLKTGSLLAACCAIGAVSGGASRRQVQAVTRFARKLGLAFQGIDDCLDFSDPGRTGKPAGIDLAQGICGLPLVCALRGPQRRLVLNRLQQMERAEPAEAGELRTDILALVRDSGALATARTVADGWSSEALSSLIALPHSVRIRIERFADRLILRDR